MKRQVLFADPSLLSWPVVACGQCLLTGSRLGWPDMPGLGTQKALAVLPCSQTGLLHILLSLLLPRYSLGFLL